MAEKNFVQVGYKQGESFVAGKLRGQDVYTTDGKTVEEHTADASKHLTTDQVQKITGAIQSSEKGANNGVATLGADGKIPADQIDRSKFRTETNVDDYNAMLALSTSEVPINDFVFVKDASGDETVDKGWASYKRVAAEGSASDWCKVAEGESLDVTFNTSELESKITDAKNEGTKLDFAYCTDEADMKSKNLREGAMVLMAVENSAN